MKKFLKFVLFLVIIAVLFLLSGLGLFWHLHQKPAGTITSGEFSPITQNLLVSLTDRGLVPFDPQAVNPLSDVLDNPSRFKLLHYRVRIDNPSSWLALGKWDVEMTLPAALQDLAVGRVQYKSADVKPQSYRFADLYIIVRAGSFSNETLVQTSKVVFTVRGTWFWKPFSGVSLPLSLQVKKLPFDPGYQFKI